MPSIEELIQSFQKDLGTSTTPNPITAGVAKDGTRNPVSNAVTTVDKPGSILEDYLKDNNVLSDLKTIDAGTNLGYSPKGFDASNVETLEGVANNYLDDAYNSFLKGYLTTKQNTELGKLAFDWTGVAVEEVIDNYDKNIADINYKLQSGQINENQFNQQRSQLEQDLQEAQTKQAEGLGEINSLQEDIDDLTISRDFQNRQRTVSQMGDDAGFVDNLAYGMPEVLGSSASLMIPQLAATFGTKLAQTAILNAIPGIGSTASGVIATAAAIGTLLYSRKEESYGELGGNVSEIRQSMISEYLTNYNKANPDNPITDPAQIPEDVMKDIRIKSRKGLDTLFYQNMTEAAGDIATALLIPGAKFGRGLGIGSKTFNKVDDILYNLNSAKNYNMVTKAAYNIGKIGVVGKIESGEEGNQFAYAERQKDAAYGLGEYENKGFLKNILDDKLDVLQSLNYSPIPGLSLRGSGRYVNDKDFQMSTNSGEVLGWIMGGPSASISAAREMYAFKKTKQDIVNNGLSDIDSKFGRVDAELYRNYFKNGSTDRLVQGLRSVAKQRDENGNPLISQEDLQKSIAEIKDLYKVYHNISDQVESIPKKGILWFGRDKQEQAVREFIKDDLFVTALNLRRQKLESQELAGELSSQGATDDLVNTRPELKALQNLYSKRSALEALIQGVKSTTDPLVTDKDKSAAIANFEKELGNVGVDIVLEEQFLKESNIDNIDIIPSDASIKLNAKTYSLNRFIDENTQQLNKLSKIRSRQDLKTYYDENQNRIDQALNVDPVQDNTDTLEKEASEILNPSSIPDEEGALTEVPSEATLADFGLDEESDSVEITPEETTSPTNPDPISTFVNDGDKAQRKQALLQILKDKGIDPITSNLRNVWDALRGIVTNPQTLKDRFEEVKELVSSFKSGEDKQIVKNSTLNNTFDIVDGGINIPEAQIVTSEVDKANRDILRQLNENEDRASGKKITNSLSLSTKNVEQDVVTKEKKFNLNYFQQIQNTSLIYPSSNNEQGTLYFKLAGTSAVPLAELSDDLMVYDNVSINQDSVGVTDMALDNLDIEIWMNQNNKPILIGYVHRVDSLVKNLLANEIADRQEQLAKIRSFRHKFLQAAKIDPNTTFTSKVESVGFGSLEFGTPRAIKAVIGQDSRPYLTYSNAPDSVISLSDKPSVDSNLTIKEGSVLLMLPIETADGTKYSPSYVTKISIGNNKQIFDHTKKHLIDYLRGVTGAQNNKNLAAYVFVTHKNVVLGNKGLRIIDGAQREILVGTNIFAVIDGNLVVRERDGEYNPAWADSILEKSLGAILPDINKGLYNNPVYRDILMNSGLFKSNILQNTALQDSKYTDLLNESNQDQQYQYFVQRTVEYSNPVPVGDEVIVNEQSQQISQVQPDQVTTDSTEIQPEDTSNPDDALFDDFDFEDIDSDLSYQESINNQILEKNISTFTNSLPDTCKI